MDLKNKYSLSDRETRFLLKKSVVALIHSASRLENVNTTFPQTKTIVEDIVNINEKQLEYWNSLLSEFYETNNDEKIIQWTSENCIHGIDY